MKAAYQKRGRKKQTVPRQSKSQTQRSKPSKNMVVVKPASSRLVQVTPNLNVLQLALFYRPASHVHSVKHALSRVCARLSRLWCTVHVHGAGRGPACRTCQKWKSHRWHKVWRKHGHAMRVLRETNSPPPVQCCTCSSPWPWIHVVSINCGES